jgi:hypothetical protein
MRHGFSRILTTQGESEAASPNVAEAGVAGLVSSLVATGVHSAGFVRLELGVTQALQDAEGDTEAPASEKAEDPGDTESEQKA